MYTIKTITYFIKLIKGVQAAKIQAVITFTFEGKPMQCLGIMDLSALATTDLLKMEADPAFIAMCKDAIAAATQDTTIPNFPVKENKEEHPNGNSKDDKTKLPK